MQSALGGSLGLRPCRPSLTNGINFRDDLSEYSSPSNWGERPGPLSLGDHRAERFGLRARRTVGEALLQAQRERDWDTSTETCTRECRCMGPRVARFCLSPLRRAPPPRTPVVFTWSEVQSLILLPPEESPAASFYLIAVTTFRVREGFSKEWILQAGSLRGRARWGIEMVALVLRDRVAAGGVHDGGPCRCCGTGRANCLSLALFMDMARVACETARLQPSPSSLELLTEVLEVLGENHRNLPHSAEVASLPLVGPHFPVAALRRFCCSVRRAHTDLQEWNSWRDIVRLIRAPAKIDLSLWEGKILPFLCPHEPSLRDPATFRRAGSEELVYPAAVSDQLSNAAERCRRTLS